MLWLLLQAISSYATEEFVARSLAEANGWTELVGKLARRIFSHSEMHDSSIDGKGGLKELDRTRVAAVAGNTFYTCDFSGMGFLQYGPN